MILSFITVILILIMMFATWRWGEILISSSLTRSIILGILFGALSLSISLFLVEILRVQQLRKTWRQRLVEREGFIHSSGLRITLHKLIQIFNKGLLKLFKEGLAGTALGWWQDSGAGKSPLSFLAALLAVITVGGIIVQVLLDSLLLKVSVLFILLMGLFSLIYYRAQQKRQLFQNQFPSLLERMADSLQAGFTLVQAIEFVTPNLPQPSSGEMARITDQIDLGFTLEQALLELFNRRPSEDLRILVEGLNLQRQAGGNMTSLMREMAVLVRSRVELKNEIRTLTAQGRLSAVVIALLVPVSLGLLSLFPGYTDVLLKTTIGNLVLVVAGILELLGAALITRLIRIEV